MIKAWWIGAALLAVGLAWQITDQVLRTLFPLSWGGPNIGGALIYYLAQLLAAAGLVIWVLTGVLLAVRRSRPGTATILIPLITCAALVVGLQAANRLLPGDIGPDGGLAGINGQVGLAANASGGPVLVLEVCRGAVDSISVVGPNVNGRNKFIAALKAPSPITTPTQVALLSPPSGWSGAPASLPLDSMEFVIASASGRQSELGQVDFSAADLAAVAAAGPNAVLYSDWDPDPNGDRLLKSVLTTRSGFHNWACDGFPEAN